MQFPQILVLYGITGSEEIIMEKESGRISEEKKKERRFVLALLTEHFSLLVVSSLD